jgi:hypothetical protein
VYSLPAEYSNRNHGCVYSDPPLSVRARLTKTQVPHGKKETLKVVASPLAHVTILFPPLNGTRRPTWHTGRAGAKGAYTYTWKVKETEKRVDLQILVATNDGRGAFRAVSYIAGSA